MAQVQVMLGKRSVTLTGREQLLILEISTDKIDSATRFVDYISGCYLICKSSVWHALKSLKKAGMVDFAAKGEACRPLTLTPVGIKQMSLLTVRKEEIIRKFEHDAFLLRQQQQAELSAWGGMALPMRYGRHVS